MTAMPGMSIASTHNEHVKAATALRNRRDRERTGLTLVDGGRECLRALEAGVDVVEAFVCRQAIRTPDAAAAVDRLRGSGARVFDVTDHVLAKVAFGDRSDGVVVVARVPSTSLEHLAPPPNALIAIVEALEKPGNLGAILRSADGAGIDAVIAADPLTDLFNPNAIRASVGTIFSVPIAQGPTSSVVPWLASRGIRAVVAVVDAPGSYTDVDLTVPTALVLGSEAAGLSATWRAADAVPVRLPMLGTADSLNVSVAAAVLFYEARRQRDARGEQGSPRT